ncbi:MAG: hypothetical protein ACR2LF_03645 [Jatrophihabitantaceae bacterium]
MTARDDIEFLADVRFSETTEEELAEPGMRPVPRWLVLLVAIAVVAAAGAVLITRHHAAREASPAPLSSPAPIAVRAASQGATSFVDSLLGGGTLFTLRLDRLSASNARTGQQLGAAELSFAGAGTSARLVLDARAHRIWVVGMKTASTEIFEFDEPTLRLVRALRWPTMVRGATALDGYLYLATDRGVADIGAAARQPRFIPGLAGAVGPVAARASCRCVIALDLGYPTDVWRYGADAGSLEAPGNLPLTDGSLGIAGDGAIWIGGSGTAATLVRLDAATLRPAISSPLARQLGPGAVIVAAGEHDIFVRATAGGDALWCVDGRTGRALQHWADASGSVTSQLGSAYLVTTGSPPRHLVLSGCAG